MRIKLKHLLPCAALAFGTASHASPPLNDLASIQRSLDAGHRVSAVIDLSRCTPEGNGQPSQTKGGLTIGSYRVLADSTLAFSDSVVAVSADNKPLQQVLRYRVKPDGSIGFTSTTLSLPDYAQVGQVSFRCAIGNGVNFIGSPW
jgi:hypothetical protein